MIWGLFDFRIISARRSNEYVEITDGFASGPNFIPEGTGLDDCIVLGLLLLLELLFPNVISGALVGAAPTEAPTSILGGPQIKLTRRHGSNSYGF